MLFSIINHLLMHSKIMKYLMINFLKMRSRGRKKKSRRMMKRTTMITMMIMITMMMIMNKRTKTMTKYTKALTMNIDIIHQRCK